MPLPARGPRSAGHPAAMQVLHCVPEAERTLLCDPTRGAREQWDKVCESPLFCVLLCRVKTRSTSDTGEAGAKRHDVVSCEERVC